MGLKETHEKQDQLKAMLKEGKNLIQVQKEQKEVHQKDKKQANHHHYWLL